MILAFDATERALARQARAARQQQLLAIFEQAPFEQAPAALALLHGSEYVVEMTNPSICAMWGRPLAEVDGWPLFEALPELAAQGYMAVFDDVRRTGQPYVAHQQRINLMRAGHSEMVYFDFVYQPLFDAQGRVDFVAIVAADVSALVAAHQQVEALSQKLAALSQPPATDQQAKP